MKDRYVSRRDWLTGVGSALTAVGLHACGQSQPVSLQPPLLPFADSPPPDRPNLVVFLADTLRADHLSCYGYPTKTSPVVDRLAESGVLFENTHSGSTWTKPALGTALTGVPARVHQAVASSHWQDIADDSSYRVQALRNVFETLPQALKQVGYSSAYLQSNPHGRPEFGYGRGFDFTRNLGHYPAGLQVTDAIQWIREEATQPFLLFIHEIDPHGPYVSQRDSFKKLHGVSAESVFERIDPSEAKRVKRFVELLGTGPKVTAEVLGVSQEANRYIQMEYDAEIYEIGIQIERLVRYLNKIGVMDNTVFTFTSDHGEGFGEHGFYSHGAALPYDELLHVPLIMAGGGIPSGVRVPHTTTMLDLFPTLLELARAPIPSYVPGSPMFSADRELLVTENRLAYVDIDKKQPDSSDWDAAIIKGRYKVSSRKKGNAYWIFDREADPGEHVNLAGSGQLPAGLEQELIESLQAEVNRYDRLSREFGEPEWIESVDGLQEDLEALGYV